MCPSTAAARREWRACVCTAGAGERLQARIAHSTAAEQVCNPAIQTLTGAALLQPALMLLPCSFERPIFVGRKALARLTALGGVATKADAATVSADGAADADSGAAVSLIDILLTAMVKPLQLAHGGTAELQAHSLVRRRTLSSRGCGFKCQNWCSCVVCMWTEATYACHGNACTRFLFSATRHKDSLTCQSCLPPSYDSAPFPQPPAFSPCRRRAGIPFPSLFLASRGQRQTRLVWQ